jgi:hypothetical protein
MKPWPQFGKPLPVRASITRTVRTIFGATAELHLTLYPLTLGGGKRILPAGLHQSFRLLSAKPYPTGVVGLHYARQES